MTTLYFIRHAQPERSADSIYEDRTYPLSEKGLADRKLATNFLQDKGIDIVLSSPFKRAFDTVAEFAEKNALEIEVIEDFRERKIADKWIGDDIWKTFSKNQWDDFSYKLTDGESITETQQRNIAALQDVLVRYVGKTIAIGTHGTALSSIIHFYDNSYGYDDFVTMQYLMPWAVKMVFDGDKCIEITKIDLFQL